MAQVRFRWEDAPDGASVRTALARRTEDELIARVDAAMEGEDAIAREELARRLLEEREPVRLVATLLGLVLPSGSKAPADGGGAPRADAGPAPDRSGVADLVGRPAGRRDSQGLAEEDFVGFFMNHGGHQALTPGRLLAAACRGARRPARLRHVRRAPGRGARDDAGAAIAWAFSSVPPFLMYSVIPVARKVWQQMCSGKPTRRACRLTIRKTSARCIRVSVRHRCRESVRNSGAFFCSAIPAALM